MKTVQSTHSDLTEREPTADSRATLAAHYRQVRRTTQKLCEPLEVEDYVVQSMPDASPVKWHLAHTTWFFEAFLLARDPRGYVPFDARYNYLFNSYYLALGQRHARPRRGLLSRPTVDEIDRYRQHVDEHVERFIERADPAVWTSLAPVLETGIHHEQQHQELLLTDIKHAFWSNPLRPAYRESLSLAGQSPRPVEARWVNLPERQAWVGHDGNGFAFDNESPRHPVFVQAFQLASRPVTNGEYRAFLDDRGYQRGELWLSDGWNTCQAEQWKAPLYWEQVDGAWHLMTLSGMQPVVDAELVCHVSYYEADAFARWAGARLPREEEWEIAAEDLPVSGNLLDSEQYHPRPTEPDSTGLAQMFGDVWEWTGSAYLAYPGYRPAAGALGEYNGKFMCNQFVLRGGSCATPASHLRTTYRNFFPPAARWQFTGFRLARDA